MLSWKIAHLTTVHPREDTRILHRQARTLAQDKEWDFSLVVADGQGSLTREIDGATVTIRDLGSVPQNRFGRAVLGPWRAFAELRRMRANVVHFHDPELIPIGFLLKAIGCKVIYDVHEDTPRQVLHKYWIPRVVRLPASWGISALEWIGGRVFDAIVVATPLIAARFPAAKTTVVHNFPLIGELSVADNVPYAQRSNSFIYIGRIAEIRGVREMVAAIGRVDERYEPRLDLAGDYSPAQLETELRSIPGWSRARSVGWAKRDRVAQLLAHAKVGLVLLHPTHNYPDAYPVKLFEYMVSGLPVIASDFPLWRRIVEDAECGLLVDPLDSAAIAEAMHWMLEYRDEAEAMGRRGRKAIEDRYNWQGEASKLRQMYRELMHLT